MRTGTGLYNDKCWSIVMEMHVQDSVERKRSCCFCAKSEKKHGHFMSSILFCAKINVCDKEKGARRGSELGHFRYISISFALPYFSST